MDWSKQAGSMAGHYQGFLAPGMFEPCAELLLDSAGVAPGQDVLDVACGTGVVSRAAAARVGADGSVVGVDMAPPMLAVARELGTPNGAMGIDYRDGDATALPVEDADFDVAVCQHGFQFFGDRPAALGEMARAVRPGGTIAVACWTMLEESPSWAAIVRALRDHGAEEAADALNQPFSLGTDDLEALFGASDLDRVAIGIAPVRTAFPGTPDELAARAILAGPLAPAFLQLPDDARDAFCAQVAREVEAYVDDGHVRPPMFTALATARRAG